MTWNFHCSLIGSITAEGVVASWITLVAVRRCRSKVMVTKANELATTVSSRPSLSAVRPAHHVSPASSSPHRGTPFEHPTV